MSAQEQARSLMIRHHQFVKNRQQSMLCRAAAEVGLPAEAANYWGHIQGKPHSENQISYDRSQATMS